MDLVPSCPAEMGSMQDKYMWKGNRPTSVSISSFSSSTSSDTRLGDVVHDFVKKPTDLPITLFIRNGIAESKAINNIRDVGCDLDHYARMASRESTRGADAAALREDTLKSSLQGLGLQKGISPEEKLILTHLWTTAINPSSIMMSRAALNISNKSLLDIYDAVWLTFFANGFGADMGPTVRHYEIAKAYGSARMRSIKKSIVSYLGHDSMTLPKCCCGPCGHPYKVYWHNGQKLEDKNAVPFREHTREIGEGHNVILMDKKCCIFPFLLPLACLILPITFPLSIMEDKEPDEVKSAGFDLLCVQCFYYENIGGSKEMEPRDRSSRSLSPTASEPTEIIPSPSSIELERLSPEFMQECKIILKWKPFM
jgi:hypothetical protein